MDFKNMERYALERSGEIAGSVLIGNGIGVTADGHYLAGPFICSVGLYILSEGYRNWKRKNREKLDN